MRLSLKRLYVAMILSTLFVPVLEAGTIEQVIWRGHQVLKLNGEIDEALVINFMRVRNRAEIWPHGAQVLLLDSPGGGVMAALAIVGLMDQGAWHTVVANGDQCASACASIVFVSGKYRTVEPFGVLGQHSCARSGIPDDECNQLMAENAIAHGVSHGSVMAFVSYTGPDDMIWFSREDADGWGLSRYPGMDASGFNHSEPRVLKMISGAKPPAQSAWRLDFRHDGYQAFSRAVSDDEREMQLNLFCFENMPGSMFLAVEINGPATEIEANVTGAWIAIDGHLLTDSMPLIHQVDPQVTEVLLAIPKDRLMEFLTTADELVFSIEFNPPYTTMRAMTYLKASRKNLIFAANHCANGKYDLSGNYLGP